MPLAIYFFLLIQLIVVSYYDYKTKKIKNAWSLINICCGVSCYFFLKQYYSLQAEVLFYPLVILLVGFILYLLKVMGGGDSKYLSSLYLIIPVSKQEDAFSMLLYSTLIIGGAFFIKNIVKHAEELKNALLYGNMNIIKRYLGKKFTFAPVIFISWLLFGWKIYL